MFNLFHLLVHKRH